MSKGDTYKIYRRNLNAGTHARVTMGIAFYSLFAGCLVALASMVIAVSGGRRDVGALFVGLLLGVAMMFCLLVALTSIFRAMNEDASNRHAEKEIEAWREYCEQLEARIEEYPPHPGGGIPVYRNGERVDTIKRGGGVGELREGDECDRLRSR